MCIFPFTDKNQSNRSHIQECPKNIRKKILEIITWHFFISHPILARGRYISAREPSGLVSFLHSRIVDILIGSRFGSS